VPQFNLYIDRIRLVLPPGPRGFCDWPFIWCDTFLRCSIELCLQGCFNARKPPLFLTKTPLPPSSQEYHQPTIPNSSTTLQSDKEQKMSQHSSRGNINSFNNTHSFNNVWNYTIVDDRSPLLTWLSPLEPRLRHQDIQERRVDNVGEWLLQTEEFRNWHDWSGEDESDKAVLFCYGGPGVGKTFIR